MLHPIIRLLLIALVCCLPTLAPAATSQLIHVEWGYTPPSTPAVSGFKLYQEGVFACQVQDSNATAMDCQVTLTAATTNFTLTATFSDGTETPHSSRFAYTTPGPTPAPTPTPTPTPAPLQAVITTDSLSGPAPLAVNFSAASSIGVISTFRWDFGDGATASGPTASHTYPAAGTYTSKLTVTSATGNTSIAAVLISVTAPPVPPAPPTAVISSSTAAGPAPLSVTFNGSGSTAATNSSIVSYSWNFGDGSTAAAVNPTHIFTSIGTYNTTLTVTDSKGLTSTSRPTPVVVTAPTAAINKKPTPVIKATPTSGTAPLAVAFDGSASTDTDGTIASYSWNFGDGSSATGKTASHSYTTGAIFTATLKVTDNQGAENTISTTITVQAAQQPAGLNIEAGEVAVTDKWIRVPLTSTFVNPIVVAGPPSYKNADPCVIRLRNVTTTGFDIRLAEWNYLSGAHVAETVSYMVLEKGRTTLPNGSIVEAGSFIGTTSFKTMRFSTSFTKVPVIITSVASENELDTISGRIRDVGLASFAYYFREQEKNTNTHANETVNFIAWEPGKGSVGSIQFEAATTAQAVTNAWYTTSFRAPFNQPPFLLADMQTTQNTDTSALRMLQITATGFQVKVEEERSKDTEVNHPAEAVGYLVFDKIEN